MALPTPQPGLLIRYNYLWRSEADSGKESGSKTRPCAIITAVGRSNDKLVVTVVPITHAPPRTGASAIELPAGVKAALGLDDERSWIVCDELNSFDWPGPDLEPIRPGTREMTYGLLPLALLRLVLRTVLASLKAGRLRIVTRTE